MASKRKFKTMSILLTMAMLLMLWPGAAYGAGPAFTGGALNIDAYFSDTYIRVNVSISEAVYGDAAATTAVDKNDFEFVISPNGGTVTKTAINAMRDTGNGDVDPGERHFLFNVYLTDDGGTQVAPSGVETITLRPAANSVFNAAGEAMETTQTLTTTLPDRKKPVFAAGYPRAGAAQAAGSKQVQLVVKPLDESVTAYYVIVANSAGAPSAVQVMAGKDSADQAALAAGNAAADPAGETSLTTGALPADAADYDAYVVIKDAANNTAGPVKIDITTPAATAANVYEIVGGASYPTLQEAIDAAAATATIRLLDTITDSTPVIVNDKAITLDLNGKALTLNTSADQNSIALKVVNGGSVSLVNDAAGFWVTGGSAGGGVYVESSSAATVTSAEGGYGVVASDGSTITVTNSVISNGVGSFGATAKYYSTATITGNITAKSAGIIAYEQGVVTVSGDLTVSGNGSTGVKAYGYEIGGSTVSVNGDISVNGDESIGVDASHGSTVEIIGDVTASGAGCSGVKADYCTVEITGDVTASGEGCCGVYAYNGGSVRINGNVESGDDGIYTFGEDSMIKVAGNVRSLTGTGAFAEGGGHARIDGAITAPTYVCVGNTTKRQEEYSAIEEGYYTYRAWNDSTVWVGSNDAAPNVVLPSVITDPPASITSSGAVLSGKVTSDGGAVIDEYGFVFGTFPDPKIGDPGITIVAPENGTTAGFTATLTGLTADTTYYARAYAANSAGRSYGEDRIFTTNMPASPSSGGGGGGSSISSPSVITGNASNITVRSAVLNGQISARGGATITSYGFSYSSDEEQWTDVVAGSDNLQGNFSYTLSGLNPNTAYYFKAYATNSAGTSYGSLQSFLVLQDPSVMAPGSIQRIVLRFYIGQNDYYVNDQVRTMDTTPIIMEDRTMLPIRYVAEALGATVNWDEDQRKATIVFNEQTIELWIDQNQARVNGLETAIDADNPGVTPVIMPPGRTMMPLRFIAQALGCQVDWDSATQEAKVTYPAQPAVNEGPNS